MSNKKQVYVHCPGLKEEHLCRDFIVHRTSSSAILGHYEDRLQELEVEPGSDNIRFSVT